MTFLMILPWSFTRLGCGGCPELDRHAMVSCNQRLGVLGQDVPHTAPCPTTSTRRMKDHSRAAPSSCSLTGWNRAFIFPCLQPCTINLFLLKVRQRSQNCLLLGFLSTKRTHISQLTRRRHCTSSEGS